MADSPDSPAHRHLREATRAEHAAAERAPIMQSLLHGTLDDTAYVRLLIAQHAVHRSWEAQHAAWLAGPVAAAGWRYSSRTEALEQDLCELGAGDKAEPIDASEPMHSPMIRDPSASWGELYVIEGSALGGQLLARTLGKRFPGHAHHFFRIGQHAGRGSWRAFQMMLDQHLPDATSRHTATLAARAMFHRFQRMLEAVRL
ncbi:biliverdin-producing heme oxygenase [Dyella sp.]|jgi:heme oxygenase|uniref:biliverdin-producing heme oxygenase n=1 Tax=Dyella sp. TaxID=1869338 RepID=UPI002D77BED3|nr:biliverdin-producing heme oxygenase [Dyella sp.]HET6432218.1 biliverdin-producing heme oxygenase [Dyella sp.]